MRFSTVLILIVLVYIGSGSASVLRKFGDRNKLHTTNHREFDPSKTSEDDSPGPERHDKGSRVWPATIKFSAYGVATLYINGIIYSKVFSPHPWNMKVDLAKGDVIAIKAEKTNSYAGVMVTIAWRGRKYRSGRQVFKVRSGSYSTWNLDEQDTWNRAVRDLHGKPRRKNAFCSWKNADVVDFKTNKFDRKAFFIWRLNSSNVNGKDIKTLAQTVYIRHVMGGEKCQNRSKRKRTRDDDGEGKRNREEETSSDVDDGDNQKPKKNSKSNGQGRVDVGIGGLSDTRFCKCRLVSLRGGTCFDMVTPGDDEGPCSARPCEPRYECVHDGETMCLMRRMLARVVMTGPRSCKKISAVTDLLVPYKR